MTVPDVPRPLRGIFHPNLFLRHLPQNPDKLLEGGGDARSQIENPAASAMQGADVGLGDIPHIDKIPGLLSVAEDRQGLFPEHPVEENGDHAALARSAERRVEEWSR